MKVDCLPGFTLRDAVAGEDQSFSVEQAMKVLHPRIFELLVQSVEHTRKRALENEVNWAGLSPYVRVEMLKGFLASRISVLLDMGVDPSGALPIICFVVAWVEDVE
jgi:hypothetical protein